MDITVRRKGTVLVLDLERLTTGPARGLIGELMRHLVWRAIRRHVPNVAGRDEHQHGRLLPAAPGSTRTTERASVSEEGRGSLDLDRVIFGMFRFDIARGILVNGTGTEIVLPPSAVGVLSALVRHPGLVLSKDELLAAGWKGAFVGDDSLTHAICQIRAALRDDARNPIYVQTIPRHGYRFVADVRVEAID